MQEILIQLLDCICLYIKQVPCQSGTIREKLLYFFIQHPKNIEIPTFFFAEKNTYFLFFLFFIFYSGIFPPEIKFIKKKNSSL